MQAREESVRPSGGRVARLLRGGTEGNARLIGWTGLVLLVLLAIEGVTILDIARCCRSTCSWGSC
jgi:hypothetical protein